MTVWRCAGRYLFLARLVRGLGHREWRRRRGSLYLVLFGFRLLLFAIAALFAFSHVSLLRCGLIFDPVALDVRTSGAQKTYAPNRAKDSASFRRIYCVRARPARIMT